MEKKIGCLLIHGFGGSVYEVSPLEQYLTEKGYHVLCPSLKGHTGRKQDLKSIRYQDWIHSAEVELHKLQKQCEQVCVVGFSMGGLIALNLANKYALRALVTLNTPIYYWDIRRIIKNIFEDLRKKQYHHIRRYFRASGSTTFAALLAFKQLHWRTLPIIPQIQCPLLVLQALDDDTVKKESAHYIWSRAASSHKEQKFYDQGGHLILRSSGAEKVMENIEGFFRQLNGGEDYDY